MAPLSSSSLLPSGLGGTYEVLLMGLLVFTLVLCVYFYLFSTQRQQDLKTN